jgi:tryptophan-rich sensory protein
MTLNAAWTPLFFGERAGTVALADITALDVAIVGYLRAAWKVDRPAALAVTPYLAWTLFASALNAELVRRNPSLR